MLFNGEAIFGRSASCNTVSNPRSTQKTGFGGLNNVDVLDLGRHGRVSDISGVLAAQDPGTLAAAIALARSYDDGQLYSFQDSFGFLWINVKVESFEPQGRTLQDARGYYQRYTMRLFHAS